MRGARRIIYESQRTLRTRLLLEKRVKTAPAAACVTRSTMTHARRGNTSGREARARTHSAGILDIPLSRRASRLSVWVREREGLFGG